MVFSNAAATSSPLEFNVLSNGESYIQRFAAITERDNYVFNMITLRQNEYF